MQHVNDGGFSRHSGLPFLAGALGELHTKQTLNEKNNNESISRTGSDCKLPTTNHFRCCGSRAAIG